MKKIKLNGREVDILRAIDFATGTSGAALLERLQMERGDMVEIINTMMEVGYIETVPPSERVNPDSFNETMIEVNPSFVHDLKEAIVRR